MGGRVQPQSCRGGVQLLLRDGERIQLGHAILLLSPNSTAPQVIETGHPSAMSMRHRDTMVMPCRGFKYLPTQDYRERRNESMGFPRRVRGGRRGRA